MLTIEQQIIQAIAKAERPLVVFRKQFSGDAVAGALAVLALLKKAGKNTTIACDGFVLPKNLSFLPGASEIKNNLATLRQMVISVDLDKTNSDEFHYDVENGQLKIYLSPQKNQFLPQDIKITASDWRHDLIITLDTPDLNSLGSFFSDHRDFFFERPIVNIDHSPANEHYGQMNLVDPASNSTCAVVYDLIKLWHNDWFDADINTCLLTGIIDKTKGFKAGLINPRTLQMSGDLMEGAARREEIIKHLYYSRDLGTLKLWGRVLTKLQEFFGGKIVSAHISQEDFTLTNTDEAAVPDILDELISTIPNMEVAVLTCERSDNTFGVIVKSLHALDAQKALTDYSPVGDRHLIKFSVDAEQAKTVAEKIISEFKKAYPGV